MSRKKPQIFEVKIDKLVHGGQGIASLADGRKAFVWNALHGEEVKFRTTRIKKSHVEGIATEISKASKYRVEPKEEIYLSTSPWQILDYKAENNFKRDILQESLQREGIRKLKIEEFMHAPNEWNYRNKMEYSFYGDEDGLHLALYNRGTHHKQIVDGSKLAMPDIDETARKIVSILDAKNVRAGDLKTLIVRSNQKNECVAALFVKDKNFERIAELKNVCRGVTVVYSDPKSPASIVSNLLHTFGDSIISESLLGKEIFYNALSFFQVNIDPYINALEHIKKAVEGKEVTDLFSGVGSIGITSAGSPAKLIEIDEFSVEMAKLNTQNTKHIVIKSAAENALEHIPNGPGKVVIFDPPRAGLHSKVVTRTIENLPERIVYLSCNPSTFARDLRLLTSKYQVSSINGFNFFPKTPHIEALATLELK